jgi:DNA polymerase-3 subunit chi
MKKIDFYILTTSSKQQAWLFACQWLEKNVVDRQRIYLNMATREEANAFDLLLWTYRDDSFIPHQLYTPHAKHSPAIQIGECATPLSAEDRDYHILLNFAQHVPDFHEKFSHIVEIVFAEPVAQQAARARYKYYRDRGYDINTIK